MRTIHIGGTASRISEQSTLDARHNGTVHYEGLVVVETHKEGGQLIVMNRIEYAFDTDDSPRYVPRRGGSRPRTGELTSLRQGFGGPP
jgi:DNA-directed RNA polymerase subunit beta'